MKDIVQRIAGDFGIWQLRTVLIIFLCKIPASWFMACVIFTAPDPRLYEYYCADGLSDEDQPTGYFQLSPNDIYTVSRNYSDGDHCTTDLYNNQTKNYEEVPCSRFRHSAPYWSLVMQFNLVCDREIFVAWTQFWHLFGVLMGGITATKLMLRFSPKIVMLMGMISQIFCGCVTGLTDDFSTHCAFRCFSAICCALMFTAGQTIFSEITGGKYRLAVATLFDQFWSIGVILLPGLSSYFNSWIHIYLAITFPTVILILLYPWIPDAPRWLLKRGRIEEVERILLSAAAINDRMERLPANLKEELEVMSSSLQSAPQPAKWWSLWSGSPRAKTHLIAAHVAWTVYVTNFNGMLLNIRSFGREYLSVNTVFTGFSEIVGCFLALYFALNTKNKWMCAGVYNIVAGLIGCLGWFISSEWNETTQVVIWMVLSSIPKAGVSISQSMLIAGTSELVPGPKQQIFTFSCIVVARIGLLTAPFINVLKTFDTALSLMAFCVLGIIGGIATCCLRSIEMNANGPPTKPDYEDCANNENDTTRTRNGIPPTIRIWTVESQISEKTTL